MTDSSLYPKTICSLFDHKNTFHLKLKWFILSFFTLFLFNFSALFAKQDTLSTNSSPDTSNTNIRRVGFQFSLIPGISTNDLHPETFINKRSINLLGGSHYALEGWEFGGLFNINSEYAEGIQMAGLFNYTQGYTSGIQFSGLANITKEGSTQGMQFTGGVNYSGNSIQGLQISGIGNVAQNKVQGLQVSGIGSYAGSSIQGLQLSGVFNFSKENMQGLQLAGLANYSKSFEGITYSPVNFTYEMTGIQVGVFNYSDKAEGIQLGLINYANEIQGPSIGLIGFVKEGRQQINIWTSASGYTNFGLKLGTPEIYTMLSTGFNPFFSTPDWQYGWTLGRHHFLEGKPFELDSEFYIGFINTEGLSKNPQRLYSYRLLFGKVIFQDVYGFAGPSMNMFINEQKTGYNSDNMVPYSIFSFGAHGNDYRTWLGLVVGIQIL